MADRQTLLDLAKRCEEAIDGSEALDLAITEATTGKPVGHRQTYVPVTRSLDAAMALVPAGWAPDLSSNPIHGGLLKFEYQCQARRWVSSGEDRPYLWCWDKVAISKASTPALALTAAALRALAAMEPPSPAA